MNKQEDHWCLDISTPNIPFPHPHLTYMVLYPAKQDN